MTPLEMEILLHYYCRADDYRDGDFSAPAVRAAVDWFKTEELLRTDPRETPRTCYVLTERGKVYVEALQKVPLPQHRWVIPWPHPVQAT
jgi:hypothetical protein